MNEQPGSGEIDCSSKFLGVPCDLPLDHSGLHFSFDLEGGSTWSDQGADGHSDGPT